MRAGGVSAASMTGWGEGEQQQEQCGELQEEQQAHAEALERHVALHVAEGGVPEQGARQAHRTPAQLEEVEQQQRGDRRGGGDERGDRREERHEVARSCLTAPCAG